MYLFFDLSANGKPKSYKAPMSDTFNWPRVVHLAWLLYDEGRELQRSGNHLIRPEGFEISPETEQAHHLTQETLLEKGIPLSKALESFQSAVEDAQYVIAHNLTIQENTLGAEYLRKGLRPPLELAEKYCLMREATWFCKLPGPGGRYKWPRLQDIHQKIFGKRYANQGEALADVSACTVCFFALLDLEAIELF